MHAWAHSGREAERNVLRGQVERFNGRQEGIEIRLTLLPEGSYNSQMQAAALADDLPDLLEFDGPYVYNYVWQQQLLPIDDLISTPTRRNLIPSIVEQGTYRGRLYCVGMYDSGLALFGRRSLLEEAGVRIPASPEDAWTADEFETALEKLAARDSDGRPLDLKLNYRGEWYTYAFMPPIVSAGGDLIGRKEFQSATGHLNGPEAVGAMRRFQRWIEEKEYVDQNIDDHAFLGGRVALSWVGHWEYFRYSEQFPEDLILIPLPDFGNGSRTAQGSWNWGITRRCSNPEAAMAFLEFLLEDRQVLEMTRANAAVPATHSAADKSDLHKRGAPLRLYVEQLRGKWAVPRPRTPAYPIITSVFQQAFDDIRHGADVKAVLDKAVTDINQDIRDNRGYPPPSEIDRKEGS